MEKEDVIVELDAPKQPEESVSLSERFQLKKHLYTTLPAFVLLLAAVFMISTNKEKTEKDFFAAKQAYSKWTGTSDSEHLETLKLLMVKHPELEREYGNKIAQKTLISEKGENPLGYQAINRLDLSSPFYRHFSKTTLLMSRSEYEKALGEMEELKSIMLADPDYWKGAEGHDSHLFAFTLLRIAMLNQELGNLEGEREAINEFKKYAGWNEGKALRPAFEDLLTHVSDGSISFREYIEHREKVLKG